MSISSCRHAYQEQQPEEKMEWLASFLKRTFFRSCGVHRCLQKNYLNRYCINCGASACKYCIALDFHKDHRLVKIYRHVYRDVVPLADMKTLIDCSKIQPYRCNKKMVISLKPLPHCGSGENDKEGSCNVCRRKLYDPTQYRFCSIACMVEGSETRHRRKGIPSRAPFV